MIHDNIFDIVGYQVLLLEAIGSCWLSELWRLNRCECNMCDDDYSC